MDASVRSEGMLACGTRSIRSLAKVFPALVRWERREFARPRGDARPRAMGSRAQAFRPERRAFGGGFHGGGGRRRL